jgi:hypothetical protein
MKWKRPTSGDTSRRSAPGETTENYRRRQDGDKTVLADGPEGRSQPRGGSERGSAVRSGPSPKLPWPARDERPRKVTYYEADAADARSEHTQLYDPTSSPAGAPADREAGPNDPVVGWLVIIAGPGKGRSVEIGIGANAIGRDKRQKISLDFGDETIHREKHAIIVFDPKSRRFFLQAGNDARNLTYLEDALVLSPTELHGGETLLLGRTQIRFVPFCGKDFCWS